MNNYLENQNREAPTTFIFVDFSNVSAIHFVHSQTHKHWVTEQIEYESDLRDSQKVGFILLQ